MKKFLVKYNETNLMQEEIENWIAIKKFTEM